MNERSSNYLPTDPIVQATSMASHLGSQGVIAETRCDAASCLVINQCAKRKPGSVQQRLWHGETVADYNKTVDHLLLY